MQVDIQQESLSLATTSSVAAIEPLDVGALIVDDKATTAAVPKEAAVEDAREEAPVAEQPAVEELRVAEKFRQQALVGEPDSEPEPQVEKQQVQEQHRAGSTPHSETAATLPELSVGPNAPTPPGLTDFHDDANAEWEEYSDDESGELYYFNARLGKTVWKAPPGFVSSRQNTANHWANGLDPIFGNELRLDDPQALAP
jgi:hypothetical protein